MEAAFARDDYPIRWRHVVYADKGYDSSRIDEVFRSCIETLFFVTGYVNIVVILYLSTCELRFLLLCAMVPPETVPLLGRRKGVDPELRRKMVHIGIGLLVFMVALGILSHIPKAHPRSSSSTESTPTVVHESRDAPIRSWPPPAVVVSEWHAKGSWNDEALRVEEHYIYSTGVDDLGSSAHIFLKQAYTYWRYGLNGPRALRRPGSRSVAVESYRYNDKAAFLRALKEERLSGGAVVFVSVTTMALECDLRDYATLTHAPYDVAPERILRDTVSRPGHELKLESLCVYTHTPDLLLRSELLRRLLAYPKPLVLVLAGDSACRLRLPATHHAVVFPNDGAPTSSSTALWFPEGLEGLEATEDREFWRSASEQNALQLTDAPANAVDDRPFLLDLGMSVNGRKPSRIALVQYLESGGTADLAALANEAGLAIRVNASVIDMPTPNGGYSPEYRRFHFAVGDADHVGGDAGSIFALSPAGDTWSSGRTLEAMLKGAVPIVDATYASDRGASAKGCDDPAAFWRDGVPGALQPAPFVFVDSWPHLPDALRAFGAANRTQLAARLRAVQEYRDKLEAYLRGSILDLVENRRRDPPPPTTCTTTLLTPVQRAAQLAAQRDYYNSDWYESFVDKPSYPTGACTTRFHTHDDHIHGAPIVPRYGAQCFHPACAPSLVHAFDCS